MTKMKTWLYRLRALPGRLLCSLLPYTRASQQTRFVVRMWTHRAPAELAYRWFDYLERRVPAPRDNLETALRLVAAVYAREAAYFYFRDLVVLSMYIGGDADINLWLSRRAHGRASSDPRDPGFCVPRSHLLDFMRDFPPARGA